MKSSNRVKCGGFRIRPHHFCKKEIDLRRIILELTLRKTPQKSSLSSTIHYTYKMKVWGEHMLGLWKFNILSWGRTLGNAWHVEGKSKLETCVLSNSNLSGHNFCAWLSFHTSFYGKLGFQFSRLIFSANQNIVQLSRNFQSGMLFYTLNFGLEKIWLIV